MTNLQFLALLIGGPLLYGTGYFIGRKHGVLATLKLFSSRKGT